MALRTKAVSVYLKLAQQIKTLARSSGSKSARLQCGLCSPSCLRNSGEPTQVVRLVELGPLLVVDRQDQHEVGEVVGRKVFFPLHQRRQGEVDQFLVLGQLAHQNVQKLHVVVHRQAW